MGHCGWDKDTGWVIVGGKERLGGRETQVKKFERTEVGQRGKGSEKG